MHACGHDGHMAAMLGFAKVLENYKKTGQDMPYNALLLFQPAEETIDGALRICGTHIFDHYNIRAIFGLHLWPMLSKGEIASRPGPMMAKSTAVEVEFEGVSAHCGEPEKGRLTKGDTYRKVKEYVKKFQEQNGSYLCRELKGVETGKVLRSCPDCIRDAVALTEEYLAAQKQN